MHVYIMDDTKKKAIIRGSLGTVWEIFGIQNLTYDYLTSDTGSELHWFCASFLRI